VSWLYNLSPTGYSTQEEPQHDLTDRLGVADRPGTKEDGYQKVTAAFFHILSNFCYYTIRQYNFWDRGSGLKLHRRKGYDLVSLHPPFYAYK
jgi:hypothetical protein